MRVEVDAEHGIVNFLSISDDLFNVDPEILKTIFIEFPEATSNTEILKLVKMLGLLEKKKVPV